MNDPEIIEQVLSGDIDAYAALVRRHHPKIIGLCLSLLRNKTEAEDAAQEAFFKAYQALSTFRQGAEFSTWLYQITYRYCLDLLRKRKREKLDSLDTLVEDHGEQIQRLLESPPGPKPTAEQADLVSRVLAGLPEDYRNILIMREINGLSYDEIAAVMECSLDAVKGRLKRARAEMEQKFRHFLEP